MDPTVAATALVSGFRRWYGDSVAGARPARNAASASERVPTPVALVGSMD